MKTDTGVVTRVYAGVDGVMAPMVTTVEKEKRRKNQGIRRQQRSAAGVGNARELPPARAGADERFKAMKIGLFYDQARAHRHVLVTENDHEAFGVLLREHAGQVAFEQAKGWDIGSGPTGAMCKNLTPRLKRSGMKWDRDHAGTMMNLIGMYERRSSQGVLGPRSVMPQIMGTPNIQSV